MVDTPGEIAGTACRRALGVRANVLVSFRNCL
jgi:hypothetical protein